MLRSYIIYKIYSYIKYQKKKKTLKSREIAYSRRRVIILLLLKLVVKKVSWDTVLYLSRFIRTNIIVAYSNFYKFS